MQLSAQSAALLQKAQKRSYWFCPLLTFGWRGKGCCCTRGSRKVCSAVTSRVVASTTRDSLLHRAFSLSVSGLLNLSCNCCCGRGSSRLTGVRPPPSSSSSGLFPGAFLSAFSSSQTQPSPATSVFPPELGQAGPCRPVPSLWTWEGCGRMQGGWVAVPSSLPPHTARSVRRASAWCPRDSSRAAGPAISLPSQHRPDCSLLSPVVPLPSSVSLTPWWVAAHPALPQAYFGRFGGGLHTPIWVQSRARCKSLHCSHWDLPCQAWPVQGAASALWGQLYKAGCWRILQRASMSNLKGEQGIISFQTPPSFRDHQCGAVGGSCISKWHQLLKCPASISIRTSQPTLVLLLLLLTTLKCIKCIQTCQPDSAAFGTRGEKKTQVGKQWVGNGKAEWAPPEITPKKGITGFGKSARRILYVFVYGSQRI